ncbi:streptophobe family protein [Geodermatophilus nigrescens]
MPPAHQPPGPPAGVPGDVQLIGSPVPPAPPFGWAPPSGPISPPPATQSGPAGAPAWSNGTPPWGSGAPSPAPRLGPTLAERFLAGDWRGALVASGAAVGVMVAIALIGILLLTGAQLGARGILAITLATVCSAVGGDPYLSASAAGSASGSISLGLLPLNVTFAGLLTLGWSFGRRVSTGGASSAREVLLQGARTLLIFSALFLPLSLLTRFRSEGGAVLSIVGQFGVSIWSSLVGALLFGVATLGLTCLIMRRIPLPERLGRARAAARAPLLGAACIFASGGVLIAVTLLLGLMQQDGRLVQLGAFTLGAGNGVLASVLWSAGVPLSLEGGAATSVVDGFAPAASRDIDLFTFTDVSGWFWLAPVLLLVVALITAVALAVRQDSLPDARREGFRFAAALAAVAFCAALLLRISVSSGGSALGETASAGGTASFQPFVAVLVFAVVGIVAGLLAPLLAMRAPVGFITVIRRRTGTASQPAASPTSFQPEAAASSGYDIHPSSYADTSGQSPPSAPLGSPQPPHPAARRRTGVLIGGVGLAVTAVVATAVVLVNQSDSLAGTWSGPVVQAGAETYTLEVTLTEVGGQLSGQAVYPEYDCGGTWAQTARTGATVTVVEQLDEGVQYCLTGSTADLTVDAQGRLHVDGGTWTATLTRLE